MLPVTSGSDYGDCITRMPISWMPGSESFRMPWRILKVYCPVWEKVYLFRKGKLD